MKKSILSILVLISLSCGKAELAENNADVPVPSTSLSSAQVSNQNRFYQFNLSSKVKNVKKKTIEIEQMVENFGGITVHSAFKSDNLERTQKRISADSIRYLESYDFSNEFEIEIPTANLSEFLNKLNPFFEDIQSRSLDCEDLAYESNVNKIQLAEASKLNSDFEKAKTSSVTDLEMISTESTKLKINEINLSKKLKFSKVNLTLLEPSVFQIYTKYEPQNTINIHQSFLFDVKESIFSSWQLILKLIVLLTYFWPLLIVYIIYIQAKKRGFNFIYYLKK